MAGSVSRMRGTCGERAAACKALGVDRSSMLSHARAVLEAWRADYNGVRPHSALANRTPDEFRAQHISVAASAVGGQNFNPGLYS